MNSYFKPFLPPLACTAASTIAYLHIATEKSRNANTKFLCGFVPRMMKLNALWEGRMFEISAHEFHFSVDQMLHTIVYLNDIQNICTHCLKNSEKRLLASSCLSVRPHGTTRLPQQGFSLNLVLDNFSKIYRENSNVLKSDHKNNGCFR